MLDKVRTILVNDGTVNALASNGIFIEEVPQAIAPPYIILSLQEGDPNNTKIGPSEIDEAVISVFGYGRTPYSKGTTTGGFDLVKACRDALDHYSGTVDGLIIFLKANSTPQNYTDGTVNNRQFVTEQEFEVYFNPSQL